MIETDTSPVTEAPLTTQEPDERSMGKFGDSMVSVNPMTFDEAMEEIGKRFSSQLVGFDPTIIISIISAIIQLLGNKRSSERTAQAVQDCCKKKPFAALVRLNLFMQRQGIPFRQRFQAAEVALQIGREAKFEEIVAFCNCCDTLFEQEENV